MGVGGTQSQPASQQSPDYPMALSKIQVMSKDELDDLLNNDEKFDDYIRSLQQVWVIAWHRYFTFHFNTFVILKKNKIVIANVHIFLDKAAI